MEMRSPSSPGRNSVEESLVRYLEAEERLGLVYMVLTGPLEQRLGAHPSCRRLWREYQRGVTPGGPDSDFHDSRLYKTQARLGGLIVATFARGAMVAKMSGEPVIAGLFEDVATVFKGMKREDRSTGLDRLASFAQVQPKDDHRRSAPRRKAVQR